MRIGPPRETRHGQNELGTALGRKSYLFVGDVKAGESLVGLYSLVATCESRELNPFEYLADVLARVQEHPAREIDRLLPGAWAAGR
jgi:transposase